MAFSQDESTYKEHARRIPRPSHNFVPEYQMSGVPHVETRTLDAVAFEGGGNARNVGTTHKFTFGSVTRWIKIKCSAAGRLYFNKTAADDKTDTHYYTLGADSTVRLELKCKDFYVVPDGAGTIVSVVAGLTNVLAEDFPDQNYSNGFLGVEDNPNP